MTLFRASYAQDRTDRLIHWSVAVLMTLAFITWLLPLGLPDHNPTHTPRPLPAKAAPSLAEIPVYEATCWTPNEFTFMAATYATASCGQLFNKYLDFSANESLPPLYLRTNDVFVNSSRLTFEPKITREKVKTLQQQVDEDYDKHYSRALNNFEQSVGKVKLRNEKIQASTNRLTTVTVPLTLFFLGLLLAVPQFLRSFLTPYNLDNALKTAVDSQRLDTQSRRDIMQAVSASLNSTINSSSARSVSLLFLVFKLLSCVAILVALVYVGAAVQTSLHDQEMEIESMEALPAPDPSEFSMTPDPNLPLTSRPLRDLLGYNGEIIFCPLENVQMQNIISFQLQCIFQPKRSKLPNRVDSVKTPDQTKDEELLQKSETGIIEKKNRQLRSVQLYEVLFTAVMVYFVFLSAVAIWNTILWNCRLLCGQRVFYTASSKSLSMDAFLVLTLSDENAGPAVTWDLAQAMQTTSARKSDVTMEDALV